ncbi:MAG: 3-deoxy-D-manno-octulosonic acid transferase [Chitinophagaceae bacterium]|nr:MAG: 3-deoxy-D-manno-octulosonic acid transferase [Chitinophagaceae bacterium]
MGVFIYNVFLFLFRTGIGIASLFNPKAKQWIAGRKDIFTRLEHAFREKPPVIWVHCASLGEFEQGRPLIEALREEYPSYKILLTFFSPSGYENRKNYQGADEIFYLPADSPSNSKRFLEIVNPSLVIFVKYEFWYYYLKKIKYRKMPLILVSALFWQKMSFFKWYGALQRKMLTRFDHLFVQDRVSQQLLAGIGLADRITISGDTRFDRVAAIASTATRLPLVEKFIGQSRRVIVAGSTWPADEQLLAEVMADTDPEWKLIIAPHEIDGKHIEQVLERFPGATRYTDLEKNNPTDRVLIIDNIGMLSRLYQYGYVSYIGGGLGKGIHNTLEAAVYGRPVFFGTVYHKFREAGELISAGAAFSVDSADGMMDRLKKFNHDPATWQHAGEQAAQYVLDNMGATKKILDYIEREGLLVR